MKKTLLFLGFITAANFTFSQGGYLPNQGFENWTNSTIYENATPWQSSNYSDGYAVENVTKSTDAQLGTYSARLETVLSSSMDTAFAYIFLGEVGQGGPDAGIPYLSNVNQIKGYYKGTILPNDTAFAMVIKFFNGNMVSLDMIPLPGSQSNWTAFTLPISAVPQDSIFLGFITSNPFVYPRYAKPGTTLYVDNISLEHSTLGAGAPLPNNSFETWNSVSVNEPDGWTTFNTFLASVGISTVTQSSDVNGGSSAAQLQGVVYFGDTIPGILIYGGFDFNNGNIIPTPYTASPVSLNGFYKYTPSGVDQAVVSMEFYNNGSIVGGGMQALSPASVYTAFSVNTNISSTPDSLALAFFAGDDPGSILLLDDVQFTGGDLSVPEYLFSFDYSTYPNPAVNVLNIETKNISGDYAIAISDLSGKLIETHTYNLSNATIDVSNYTNGNYYITLTYKGKSVTKAIAVTR